MNNTFSLWKKHARGSLSLCLIMKNEGEVLPRMLKSIQGLVDEIIAVDTGSSDTSREIIRSWGGKVFNSPWEDDFSKPRNFSMDQATKDWILVVDADEVISQQDHEEVRKLCSDPSIAAYRFDTRNYSNNPLMQGFRPNPGDYPEGKGFRGFIPSTKTRLVQRKLGIRWQKVWHELLDYDLVEKGYQVRPSQVAIHHLPSRSKAEQLQKRKDFYLHLGEKKVMLDPKDNNAWWELSIAEYLMGYLPRATYSLKKALEKGAAHPDRYFLYSQLARKQNLQPEATFAFEKAITMLYPNLTHINPELRRNIY